MLLYLLVIEDRLLLLMAMLPVLVVRLLENILEYALNTLLDLLVIDGEI